MITDIGISRTWLAFVLAALMGGAGVAVRADDAPGRADRDFFESKVRPILATRCLKCHGPDKQRGKLRLDSHAALLAGGESGVVVVPGKPDESLLVEAINYASFEMPPDGQLSPEDIETLTDWIGRGAFWPADEQLTLRLRAGAISDVDRTFWAYLPPTRVAPPVAGASWGRNEIDRFIALRLAESGLTPAEPATPLALVRRVYLDLIGVPPAPEDVAEFLADPSDEAYAELIERLLESPQYGERWASLWLDLVRYAESDGYKADGYRDSAWRYRDYVIRALNSDKPYDRFVMEQLAGDEIDPENPEALVATGFLRNGIYEFNQRDVRAQWDGILNDITDTTADVFLGLGLSCARCHDHKFDPLLQEDYYRLKAFFAGILPRDDIPLATDADCDRYARELAEWEERTGEIRREMGELEGPLMRTAERDAINKFPLDIRPMILKGSADRLPLEHQLAELSYRQVIWEQGQIKVDTKLKGDEKERWLALGKQLAEHERDRPHPLPTTLTVTDVGPVAPDTFIPGTESAVPPGFPTVLGFDPPEITAAASTTGRRTALARWITRPDNPLTSRVIVNRIWQAHFGRGIVASASDFGHLGEPPSHPELLDWLATWFVDSGWSLKQLHRLIMTSDTYRQSAVGVAPPVARVEDPQNRLLWKMNVRRLHAEQIRDSMLAVSGELNEEPGGPGATPDVPRRSIYTRVMRNDQDPLLGAFDAPDRILSSSERNVTTTPVQSLLMINGDWTLARSAAFARRLAAESADEREWIRRAYELAYARAPGDSELAAALEFLARQRARVGAEAHDAPALAAMPGREGTAIVLKSSSPGLLCMRRRDEMPRADLTIEAFVVLDSLYDDASVRTIASQWDGRQTSAGWSLGVTSQKSKHQPGNVILQLAGTAGEGHRYEVVASDLLLELNTPYYIAASIVPDDLSPAGITFYVKNMHDGSLRTASVAHHVRSWESSACNFVVGGRDKITQHRWDGLIDDVRLTGAALHHDQLLINGGAATAHTVGFWQFETGDASSHDRSGRGNHLEPTPSGTDPARVALIDFCHVLLNSSEFLYVD